MSAMHLNEKLHAALEQRISDEVASTIVKRGWQYYLDGHVKNAKAGDHDNLYGVVQGSDLYAVVIDAGHFGYSSCTCSYEGFCKHMAAVYFQYCSILEGGQENAEQTYFRLLGLTPASVLLKKQSEEPALSPLTQQGPTDPGYNGSTEQWLEWMEATHGDVWRKCRHSLHALQPLLQSLKGLSKNWEKPLQRLHWSTAVAFVLDQAERAILTVDSFSRYYHEMSFIRMAEPWVDHLYTLVSDLIPVDMDTKEMEWANSLIAYIKIRASNTERQLFEWDHIYLAVSEKLSENRSWYEQELQAMLLTVQNEEDDSFNASFSHVAIGMMYFLDNEDELSIAHFAKANFERSQKVMYPCAALRLDEAKWDQVKLWMSFLFEHVYAVRNGRSVGPFVSLCRRADQDRPDIPIWTDYMTQLLPHSYTELSDHWLNQKYYEEWADLQLLIGSHPDDISVQALREVAKLAPRSLMPLYHQSVETWMLTRNRQGYRMAVKQLKKLEKLYKAEKDTNRWNIYIEGLVRKHQRLRAFQEELWKGKIVT